MVDSRPHRSTHGSPDRRRGQSELVGFLLIFSVVVLTIALVGVAGFVGLESAQDFQRTTNAEQAFTALADNVDDVVHAGAPSRTTEVRLADAQLSLDEPETITVTLDDEAPIEFETHPLVYDSGTDTTIAYHGGALVRTDGDSAVMVREPDLVLTDETVILPVVATTQERGGQVGGTTAVDVRTRHTGTDLVATNEPVDTVTLDVTSSNAEVWTRYFEQYEDDGPVTNVDTNDDSVTVTIDTNRVYVTVHRVDVTFH